MDRQLTLAVLFSQELKSESKLTKTALKNYFFFYNIAEM